MEAGEKNASSKGCQIGLDGLSSAEKGSYVLLLYLSSKKVIKVGKLGEVVFPKGYYAYVGSAFGPGGLRARLRHHLHITNNPHWHIDYLREHAKIKEILICKIKFKYEHKWATMFQNFEGMTVPVPGFGSSDCRCVTHLFAFERPISLKHFQKLINKELAGNLKILRVSDE